MKLSKDYLKELSGYTEPTETHIYMSNVNKVLDATKDRLRRLKAINIEEGNYEVAEGLHIALCEMAFITSEIMLEQLKTTTNV